MQQLNRALVGLNLLIILFISAPVAIAQESQTTAVSLSAEAGFDGHYKDNFWVPIHVTITNDGPAVEGQLQVIIGDSASRNEVVYSAPISLPNRSSKRQTLYIYLPNLTRDLAVEFVDGAGRLASEARSISLDRLAVTDMLYGVASSEPGEWVVLEEFHSTGNDAAVAFLDLRDLPDVPPAWNALDVLFLHDVDTGQLTAAQLSALKGWVDTGGQLVVVGGLRWQQTTTAVADLLPVSISDVQSLDNMPALRAFAGLPFRDPGPYLVTISTLRQGELVVHEEGLPLLARRQQGRGAVYFLALDPNLAPLLDWNGGAVLWSEIAARTPRLPAWGLGAQNSYSAANAVSSLPSLSLPSAVQLFFFLLLYVIVVGPLNYVVLKRINRRELAWLTIPGAVMVFSVIAYLAGFQLKGNDPILNQMAVAFGSTDGSQVRVQSLVGMYSPRRASYDLSLPVTAVIRPFEQNFGSLSGSANIDAVERGSDVTVKDIRIDVSDMETFVADSYQPVPSIKGQAELGLNGGDIRLDITVQNNGDIPLQDAAILVGLVAIPLGDLDPGEMTTVSERLSSGQTTAAAGPSSGVYYGSYGPPNSPLTQNYATILGTTNYFNDRDAYPRWQLLESITPPYSSDIGWYPRGTATLIGWSDRGQLDMELSKEGFEPLATTLYFLELPLNQTVVGGQDVTIPKRLLDWQVLAESGVYNAQAEDLYMPPGWIEFEFQPWPEFQNMNVSELAVSLIQPDTAFSQPLPRVALWDWAQEAWITVQDAQWGRTPVAEPLAYLSQGNTVRLRLQNSSPQAVEILEVYPELTGDLSR